MPVLDGIKEGILLDVFPVAQQGLAAYLAGTIARLSSIPFQSARLTAQAMMTEMARFQKANPGLSREEILKATRTRQMDRTFWKDLRLFQSQGAVPTFRSAVTKSIWSTAIPFATYENVRDYWIWNKTQSNTTSSGDVINWHTIYQAGALGGFTGGLVISTMLPTEYYQATPKIKQNIEVLYPDEHNAKLRANLFTRHTIRSVGISMMRQTLFLTSLFATYDAIKYALTKSPETEAEKIQAQLTETENTTPQDPLVYQIEKTQKQEEYKSSTWFERLQKRSRFFETAAPFTVVFPASILAVVAASATVTPILMVQVHATNLKNPMSMKECYLAAARMGFRGSWRAFVVSSASNVIGFAPMLMIYEHCKHMLLPRGVS